VSYSFGVQYYYPDKIDLSCQGNSFKASELTIVKTKNPLPKPPVDASVMTFGKFHTDHLLEVDWDATNG
jgi:branched-chain amino acid aminotransferase